MTTQKHLKARVRARMEKTGERYAAARAHVVGTRHVSAERAAGPATPVTVNGIRHFPGSHPETTALRIVATHAGVRDGDGNPLSEPLVLAIGGGVGAGVFSFHYEKEHVSTLFLAGRHRWDDSRAFVEHACARLGIPVTISETGSKAQADRDLRAALEHGPAIAWVDLAVLHTRALPSGFAGGAYHVVTVYELDDVRNEAVIGDLAGQPIRIPLGILADARARIRAHRNRVLGLDGTSTSPRGPGNLADAIRAGLRATVEGLTNPRGRNFSLEAFRDLAQRIHGTAGRDSWSRVFPRGPRLWNALSSMHEYVDHYGSGGGLMRPLFADGLAEATEFSGDERIAGLVDHYRALGRRWHELAEAALPAGVPLLDETGALQDRRDALWAARGPEALPEIEAIWVRLSELEAAAADFPLDAAATDDLLAGLRQRLVDLHTGEAAALDELRALA